jgi:hypothetical protein
MNGKKIHLLSTRNAVLNETISNGNLKIFNRNLEIIQWDFRIIQWE